MDIIVCIKQVPDTNEVKIDEEKGTLIREGVPSIINPEDRHGLEEAIRIKEKFGGRVTVLSMGPPQAESALREAIAMGADEAILLCDKAFAGSDTWATAYTLAQAIRTIDNYDLVICGIQASDGDTGQVGPQIAENLNLAQITYVTELEIDDQTITAKRDTDDKKVVIKSSLPALITVEEKINNPRYPTAKGIVKSYSETNIPIWGPGDFKVKKYNLGLDASPTQVVNTFVPTHEREGEILEGESNNEIAEQLVNKLKKDNIL